MVNRIINLRLGDKLLKEIDLIVRSETFESRTEFIRETLRKAVEERRKERLMEDIKRKLRTEKRPVLEEHSVEEPEAEKPLHERMGRHSVS